MAFHQIAVDATAIQMSVCGDPLIYISDAGTVTINGIIEQTLDVLGLEAQLGESRWVAILDRTDAPDPRRGNTLEDERGAVFELQEELELSDNWVTVWSLTKQ